MRRFGLRLGLVLNPAVVVALLAVMALIVAGPGAASSAFSRWRPSSALPTSS